LRGRSLKSAACRFLISVHLFSDLREHEAQDGGVEVVDLVARSLHGEDAQVDHGVGLDRGVVPSVALLLLPRDAFKKMEKMTHVCREDAVMLNHQNNRLSI